MPDGRQEVDLEEVVVLFTDPEEVKQGRSHLVVVMVIMIINMIVISIMIVLTVSFEQKICPQSGDPPH